MKILSIRSSAPARKYPPRDFRAACGGWYSKCRLCPSWRNPDEEKTIIAELPTNAVVYCRKFIVENGRYVSALPMTGTD
jgi:hypothetical protein